MMTLFGTISGRITGRGFIMKKDNNKENTKNSKDRKVTSRQVVAMAGVILLALLYVATLVVAIVDTSASGRLLWMCLFATIAIPILIWVYIWMYGKLTGRKTMTDPDPDARESGKTDAPE